jgi:hypothetical protein
VVAGEAGLAALWHSCTLHGAQAEADGQAKLSLRYRLIRRDPGRTGLDVVNTRVTGPL